MSGHRKIEKKKTEERKREIFGEEVEGIPLALGRGFRGCAASRTVVNRGWN